LINDSFRDWACSLSGCDGGNPNASTWLCGIEWGGGSYGEGIYYEKDLPEEISRGRVDPTDVTYDWAQSITYTYGRSFAKLYAAMNDENVSEYRALALSKWDGSEVFKLNLYPIAFDSTSEQLWHEYGLDRLTGFSEKHLFQTWCFVNRFPVFSKLRAEKKPRLIIGTGVSYLRDFFLCFGGNQASSDRIHVGEITPKSSTNTSNKRRYYWVDLDQHTTLVVIPFFSGTYGLNSDYLLHEMGRSLRRIRDGEEFVE